jgi:DNA-directed RNA polymerase subunit alpha
MGARARSGLVMGTDDFFFQGGTPAMTRIPLNTGAGAAMDLRTRLEMSTAEIGLSVRTTNCLEERGIFTVNDLLHSTRDDLLSISNFGEKTLEEVYIALEKIGFYRNARRELASA